MVYQIQIVPMYCPNGLLSNLVSVLPIQRERMKLGNLEKIFGHHQRALQPYPQKKKNPLIKLLMDVSMSQETLLEDYVLLTNRFNIHRCSDYCLKKIKNW